VLLAALSITLSAAPPLLAGTQVAFVSDQANKWNNWDIYLRDLDTGTTTRLTTDAAIDNHPDLSPDGTRVVFSSTRASGEFELFLGDISNVEGSLRQLTLHDHLHGTQTNYPSRHPHFHPNGSLVVFSAKNRPHVVTNTTVISECSSPKIVTTVTVRYYEGINIIQLDSGGNRVGYKELDIRDAWDQVNYPGIWVNDTSTYVGHPSFSHAGTKILFSGSIDGDGKVWEVYVTDFDPVSMALVTNSLRRVTLGPNTGPNPIKMSAGAHFTGDDSQILFSSTRTDKGNSQIFRLPATAVDTPVGSATQMTSHPANDYVPEPLMDGSFIVTSDLGMTSLCWPGPGPKADLDLVLIGPQGGRKILGNESDDEMMLIADEVSWFCGLKPNLSSCTFQPRIMSIESLWLEFTAYDHPGSSPIPPDLLLPFGYAGQAVAIYSNGFWNMSSYMSVNAASTWSDVTSVIAALDSSGFPGLGDDTLLTNWLASTESTRNQKFVVASIMENLGLGPAQSEPAAPQWLALVSDQASRWNNWDIYLRDLNSGYTTRLTADPAIDNHPDLSPDGQSVVFSSTRGSGEFDLWWGQVANVEATLRQLTFHSHPNGPQTLYPSRHPHFHPDGKTILFTSKNRPLDSPIKIVSECSSPKIIVPPRFYEGVNVIQLDETGNVTNYVELDIRNAWDSVSFPDIWVPGTGTYVGHPSFSHAGTYIVFSGSIDGDGKNWEVYIVGYNPTTVALVSNSLRRVTFGPAVGPNPIKMSAGAHFTEDDTQILFSSTRTAMGNSQIFRLPATSVDRPVTSATQLTSHPANDYVPEPLMDGSFVVTSDLGTNGLCGPGPGPKADHDLVIVKTNGDRTVTGNVNDEELQLIGDEVSWFCGLKPNLSSCTFQPRIMCGEALWLEWSAWFYSMGYSTSTPIPSNLLSGYNYTSQAIPLYALGFANMDAYMHENAPNTWSQILQTVAALNYSNPSFPGLTNQTLLVNWLAMTETYRQQKFVVPSVMYDVGLGASLPTQPRIAVTRSGDNMIMSWPTYWVGYSLQTAGVLDSPSAWRTTTMPWPIMVGGQNVATQAIGATNLFFRLKH